MKKKPDVKKLAVLGMLAAVSYLAMLLLRIPVVSFLKYEPKDVVIVIAGFLFGPLSSITVSLCVSLVEMLTTSDTGIIGCIMNFISTCAFACPAALLYKRHHTQTGAVAGLLTGTLTMVVTMLAWNYMITPLYLDTTRQEVAGMLFTVFMPFNLLKGGLNTALTLFLYKPLVQSLRRAGMVPLSQNYEKGKKSMLLLAVFLVVTCVLAIFLLRRIM